jgi:hypothetical protein
MSKHSGRAYNMHTHTHTRTHTHTHQCEEMQRCGLILLRLYHIRLDYATLDAKVAIYDEYVI